MPAHPSTIHAAVGRTHAARLVSTLGVYSRGASDLDPQDEARATLRDRHDARSSLSVSTSRCYGSAEG